MPMSLKTRKQEEENKRHLGWNLKRRKEKEREREEGGVGGKFIAWVVGKDLYGTKEQK